MTNKHKQDRKIRRIIWKKIKKEAERSSNLSLKPKNYKKLKIYELRKRKRLSVFNKKNGYSKHHNLLNHDRKVIELEKHIDFENHMENMVKLTNDINNYISKYIRFNFSIDHKKIESISIGGLLYLVGQISKATAARYHDGDHHVKFNPSFGLQDDMRIRYLFDRIGYWRYFGITNPYPIDESIKENYFLSIQTSTKSNIDLLNEIKKFINENVDFIKKDYEIEYQFDDAIKEAMGNSIEHAYPKGFSEVGKLRGKWWICGHYNKINQSIELVFYDYGVGIRNSMKYNLGVEAERVFWDRIKDAPIFKSDADLIEMAINEDLSKYKNYVDHDRGKGFKRFKNFAKSSGFDCELTIVSNTGKYKMSYNAQTKSESIQKSKLSANIDGMLIKWKIDLKKGSGDE